jgi:hypothetical protein
VEEKERSREPSPPRIIKNLWEVDVDLSERKHLIDEINETGVGLTQWEVGFMESATEQVDEGGSLSVRQEEILQEIYDKRCK